MSRVSLLNLRQLAKAIFYRISRTQLLPWYIVLLAQWMRSIESRALVQRTSRVHKLRKLSVRALRRSYHPPEVAFILGKGPSRGLLNESERKHVSESISVGLNDSIYDDISPTFEMRELLEVDGRLRNHVGRQINESRLNSVILSHVSVGGPVSASSRGRAIPIIESGPEDASRFRIYSSSNLMTSSPLKSAKVFSAVVRMQKLYLWPSSILSGSHASLVRAISLLQSLGAKRIVLIGVDLLSDSDTSSVSHKTDETKGHFAPRVSDFLVALNDHTDRSNRGNIIFLAKSSGALSRIIPTYEWN